jgi:hypothetical protein
MRPLARRLFLVSRRVCALPTYFFNKLYISEFGLLHTFLFLGSSRFVKFALIYDRFPDNLPLEGHDSVNKSLFVRIEEHKFVYL